MFGRSLLRARLIVVSVLILATFPRVGNAQQQQPAEAEDPKLAEAKMHFARGVEHSNRSEWDAALAEFLESRRALPTARNTFNAAVCLRHLNRFDEAVDMYEAMLRDFPDFTGAERPVAERELAQLKASVGTIELRGGVPGSTVVIDARERGTLPLSAPVRVGAGTHTIRVTRDGYVPFETSGVQVGGLTNVVVVVEQSTLAAGGRLRVAEQSGRSLDVVVDNAVVGKTPWDGILAPGNHTVVLRGEKNLGTQPVVAAVKLAQTLNLNLLAEELEANVRIVPTPITGGIALDGIPLGRGVWEGRLRAGSHEIEATADGYLPLKRTVDLQKDASETVTMELARDPKAFAAPSARFGVELDASMPFGVLFGGDVSDSCTGACSASLPFGGNGVLHGIYQAGSGFGAGVDVGYLVVVRKVNDRPESIGPAPGNNDPVNDGPVRDSLRLSALRAGASGQYRAGQDWPILARLGAGVLLGSVSDTRAGSFVTSEKGGSQPYQVNLQTTSAATYIYVAPELRLARKLSSHFEISAGVEVLLMAALSQPTWDDKAAILKDKDTAPTGPQGDGTGTFGKDTTLGSFVILLAPGIGGRYDF